jgi:N-acetylglucosaminyl-diphospho-decaprenol L-rhamnosyltransferase
MFDLSIIIVSWNVRDLLEKCLASIEAGRGPLAIEVLVVDSASSDGTPEMVTSRFPWVHLMVQTENVGFTRGCNIGLAQATGRYLLLLNPDTEIVGTALVDMAAFMDERPAAGVIGPGLEFPDGQIQSSRRRFPTLATAFFESTWLQPVAPRPVLRHYYMEDTPPDAIVEVDWVTGACLMVRSAAYKQAGQLDENYFMYSEEMEWQRRIKTAGWKIFHAPQIKVIHHEGKSSEQVVAQRHIYFQQSKIRYYRDYHGTLAAITIRLFLLCNYAWQFLIEILKGLLGSKRSMRRQRAAAYYQVLKTGLPPASSCKSKRGVK